MASPRSVDSSVSGTTSLSDHIKSIVTAFDSTIKLAKVLGEARGNGSLKPGKKISFNDDTKLGIEDLGAYCSSIKNALREIPKMVNDQRKAEKAAKKAARSGQRNSTQPPIQFEAPLIQFFNSVELGHTADGKRLQDHPDMALFFKSGVGNRVFGVSLFNVMGYAYKKRTGNTKVFLDESSRRILSEGLKGLIDKKKAELSDPTLNDEQRMDRMKDITRLESGEIQNKDYMSILSIYKSDTTTTDLTPYTEGVAEMCRITKQLNASYSGKAEKEAAAEAAPAVQVKGLSLPPVPVVTAKTATQVPVVPTVNARGASPVATRAARK